MKSWDKVYSTIVMTNSCLTPFYEYIIKHWIEKKEQLPQYEDVNPVSNLEFLKEHKMLETRKKDIWSKTKKILEKNTDERVNELRILKKKDIDCTLCLSCESCERYYWEQLEIVLSIGDGEKKKKCEFLIPEEIKDLLEQKDKPVNLYLDYYKHQNTSKSNYLVMLKGFSSSTPILLNYAKNTNFYSGGGFYFRWNDLGVVVDPGYLFVQNLHDYGLSVLDIDVVIVTHEHLDHSSDCRLLDDLHYNVSSKVNEHEFVWDNETFSLKKQPTKKHTIKWYMDQVTFEEAMLLSQKRSGYTPKYNELYCVNVDKSSTEKLKKQYGEIIIEDDYIRLDNNVAMRVFPTKHEQYEIDDNKFYFNHTFGCAFECCKEDGEKRSIGYTSDTSFKSEVSEYICEIFKECQIIIANISGIYKDDILLQNAKARHLGYYGCFNIVDNLIKGEQCNLKLYLLSEFSNQVSDIRYSVAKYMQQDVNELTEYYRKDKIAVIPTEVALTIDLSILQIKCTSCGKYSKTLHILKPFGENCNLQYICPKCMYTVNE